MLNIQSIIDYTAANGGGTFNPITGDPLKLEDGYIAAVKNIGKVTIGDNSLLSNYFMQVKTINKDKPVSIGTWLDDGFIYVDAVNVFRDEKDAIRSCVLLDELAYYDVAKGKSVYLNKKVDYELKVLVPDGSRIELSRANELQLTCVEPREYTLEKHYIGSHFEILADFISLHDAQVALAELQRLNRE